MIQPQDEVYIETQSRRRDRQIAGLEKSEPQDLSRQAINLARRLQALPNGRMYIIILTKQGGNWQWSIAGDGKVEKSGGDE